MKKTKLTVLLLIALLVFSASGCSPKDDSIATSTDIDNKLNAYRDAIAQLEGQLDAILKEQKEQNEESEKEIAELKAELETLKNQNAEQNPSQSDKDNNQENSAEALGFKYILVDKCASITAYEGSNTKIVIPTTIDGYKVTSIADGAFENSNISNVIISEGVESIGWFAFDGCTALKSITIPSSVKSIGYSAFGTAESSLTIYCHSESFALSYAKSYGLTYTVI